MCNTHIVYTHNTQRKLKQRKKIKRIRIDVLLTEDRYEKLMKICGDFKTITEGIHDSIDWKYGKMFPNEPITINDYVIGDKTSREINVRNEETLTEEQEREEFNRLKAQMQARKAARKEGAFND